MTFLFFSETQEEHIQHVHLVLQCLLEDKLFVKADKYEFHATCPFPGFRQLSLEAIKQEGSGGVACSLFLKTASVIPGLCQL